MILGIHGKIGSGKGYAAKVAAEIIRQKCKVTIIHALFMGKLKKFVEDITGVKMTVDFDNAFDSAFKDYTQEQKNQMVPEYGMSIGQMLQFIGQELMKNQFSKNVWIHSLMMEYDKEVALIGEKDLIWIIPDVRMEDEAQAILKRGGKIISVRAERSLLREKSNRDLNHSSETVLDGKDHYFSHVILNNGTPETMRAEMEKVLTEILDAWQVK